MTGLIYVAIIAVWAVVLVPAWLRRHDHLDPERSIDRFSRSMQTLASRPPVLGGPLPEPDTSPVADPQPEVLRITRPDLSSARQRASALASRADERVRPSSAAARRRAVLAVLLVALALVGGLVATGVLLPVALAAPATLVAAFLGVARHQVGRARRVRTARSTGPVARPGVVPASARSTTSPAGATWEARSAPLPTYVTAPPAPGFPRAIDTAPGAWTAAAMLERAQQEKLRAERMAAAKAEAIARAKAEQAAAEARTRDDEYLAQQAGEWSPRLASGTAPRRRVVNE